MIAAIDPGLKGAIALLYGDSTLYVYDMPVLDKEVNGAAIYSLFTEFLPRHIYIESQNSFLMGRTSAFNFGQQMGVLKGVMAAMQIPHTGVTPAVWKKHYGLSRDKDASRSAAIRLFPDHAEDFQLKKHDGRAEAALIALWAQEKGVMR